MLGVGSGEPLLLRLWKTIGDPGAGSGEGCGLV